MTFYNAVDRWFKISERGTSVSIEIRAGVVTFLTMSYILLVNPLILSQAGLPLEKVVASTALTGAVASFLVGVFANQPFGIAPGMGLNAYLVFSQVIGMQTPVEAALACCFTAACLVGILALIRALTLILHAVPNSIKLATVVGMGLLLSFIGLQQAKVVVANKDTMVGLGDLTTSEAMLATVGLAMIAGLHFRNVKGSILIGIMAVSLGYWIITPGSWPKKFFALPSLQWFKLDFSGLMAFNGSMWGAVLAYMLVMIFDIGGAMFGLGKLANLVVDNHVPGAIATYLAASAGTAVGALTGTTPLIIAAESAVGIKEGGRTGLVGVTIAGCFCISLVVAPFLQSIPEVANAPVLVLVGTMMMGESCHIDWSIMTTAVPAFLTIVIQPFTFSIANGIYAGLIMSVLLFFITGNFITAIKELIMGPEELDEAQEPLLEDGDASVHGGRPAGSVRSTASSGLQNLQRRMSQAITDAINDVNPFELKSQALLVNYKSDVTPGTSPSPPSYLGQSAH